MSTTPTGASDARATAPGARTTEPSPPPLGVPPGPPPGPPAAIEYSRDYWDGVFQQLGRRRRVRWALALLALLYGLAIYAPLIANDRPYVLDAVDLREFSSAQRSLSGVTTNYARLMREGEAAFTAGLRPESQVRSFSEALAIERAAVDMRVTAMRRALPDDAAAPLDEYEKELAAFESLAISGSADQVSTAERGLRDTARELRNALTPLDLRNPDAGGVQLVPSKAYPLFESISRASAFFMSLWLCVLTWPLWNRLVNRVVLKGDRTRIRRARRWKFGAVLGFAALFAWVWGATVGGSAAFETSPYKAGLTSGDIVALRVVMPPVAMGFAETHINEAFRPPTWTALSELDEDGFYVRGSRTPLPDPVTGIVPPASPVEVRYGEPGLNHPLRYPLGTDKVGQDLLSRLLWGARISLTVGLISTTLLVTIGVILGSLAGYAGGRLDIAISRVIEVVQAFPAFFLILVAVAVIPSDVVPPIYSIVIVIALVGWTGVARLVRGEFLKLKSQDFVVAARALGFGTTRVVFRHILPNALGPVLVAASFAVASGILIESSISFLGFGVKLPIPSWGTVINESRDPSHWWIQVFPGFLIFVTVFCYNLVGEGLRDALDPRMKV